MEGRMPATLSEQLICDAEVVAAALHLDPRRHRHGPLIGWVICRAGDADHLGLGLHEVVARVTGRSHWRTAQRAALDVVRAGCEVTVHQVRRCGCMVG